jgi:aldose 1-epimerase
MKPTTQLLLAAMAGLAAASLIGCASMSNTTANITHAPFGTTPDGQAVELYTLRNAHGMEAKIMTYGGIVTSLKVPDKHGHLGDVVLGFDTLDGYVSPAYLKGCPYFGALIGRYGNRIALGHFNLEGQGYQLATNNTPNHLHGGVKGFDKVVWAAKPVESAQGPELILSYVSPDGEEGYPGNLVISATYSLTEDNALKLEFSATTDRPTIVNLTHHSYFNLQGSGDILKHEVFINADHFTPVTHALIPTGELRPVAGTPFDFRTATPVGSRINSADEQIKFANGYDDNWVLNKPADALGLAASVYEPTSGRLMEVFTTSPGVQFYTGNFLDGSLTGKGGWVYQFRNGLCLEPQHFPDSPNQPAFPTTELKPGQIYSNTIIYKFSVK